jgi:phosphoribosylformimino-5-aminoimidazole carboxamide ribonucleotide (ProFAR) isomerase
MNQSIKDKIHELFISTPSDVSVGYGKNITNGEYTGEIGIVFNVEKKKPLNEIPENEILPTSVEIGGVTYITDVFERGKLIPLACSQQVLDNCYGWQTTTQHSLWDTLSFYQDAGIKNILCTDVSRDGMMSGPSIRLYQEAVSRFPTFSWQASGGVRHLDDIQELSNIGLAAVILGRVLYDPDFSLKAACNYQHHVIS